MIGWVAAAVAAPALETEPGDPFVRCAAEAEATAGPVPAFEGGASDRVAIVVGVPCHRSPDLPALAYSTRDAVRVATLLEAGGFTVLPLLTVVDRRDLLAAIERAAALVSPDGTLFVYFSGHGVLREEQGVVRRYLVMSDTDLATLHTSALEVRGLELRLDAIDVQNRVIVQDTCFASRAGGKSLGLPGSEGGKGLALLEPPLRLAEGDLRLYASRFFEQALESPELGGSVYTSHWLDAFGRAEADLDGDRCVGLIEAHRWAAVRTIETRDGFQVPQIASHRSTNLLLGCEPGAPTRAVVVASPGDDEDQVTLIGSDGAVAWDREPVVPGTYRIRVEHLAVDGDAFVPERVLDTTTRLAAGEWFDVEQEIEAGRPFVASTLDAQLALAVDSAPIGAGLTVWGATRDKGLGRVMVGASGRWSAAASDPLAPVGGEALAWAGWARSFALSGAVRGGLGPTAGAGWVWLDTASATGVGPAGQLTVRGWLARRTYVATVDLGIRALLVERDLDPTPGPLARVPAVGPVATLGVGARL